MTTLEQVNQCSEAIDTYWDLKSKLQSMDLEEPNLDRAYCGIKDELAQIEFILHWKLGCLYKQLSDEVKHESS